MYPTLRKPTKEAGATGQAEGWLVTFNDLLTLLFTFFVLIIAFSSVRGEFLKDAAASVRRALGAETAGAARILSPLVGPLSDRGIETEKARREAERELRLAALHEGLKTVLAGHPYVFCARIPGSVTIRIPAAALFDPSSAALTAHGAALLAAVSGPARGAGAFMTLEAPRSAGGAPHRAGAAVADFLTAGGGMSPERINLTVTPPSPEGGEDYRPVTMTITMEKP